MKWFKKMFGHKTSKSSYSTSSHNPPSSTASISGTLTGPSERLWEIKCDSCKKGLGIYYWTPCKLEVNFYCKTCAQIRKLIE